MAKKSDIRGSRKQRIIGKIAGWAIRLLGATLRIEFIDRAEVLQNTKQPILWALWHQNIFVMPYVRLKYFLQRPVVVLTSASKDGAVLETAVGVCGIGAVRGSSSRRAVAALVALRKAIKEGKDVCITPDGPRGPKHVLQPGIVKVAESTHSVVVAIHVSYANAWQLKTWDAFRIPKPFSKVRVVLDEPIAVESGMDDATFELQRQAIEQKLRDGAAG